VVTKNWLPLVFLPALAMESRKGRSCLSLKFSSAAAGPMEHERGGEGKMKPSDANG